MVMN